jgi:hypothetical protein
MFAKPNVVSRDHSLWKATIMRGLKKNECNQSVSYSQIFGLFLNWHIFSFFKSDVQLIDKLE